VSTLSKQNILITGASRGIGKACALAFAREGANVAIGYANDAAAADETMRAVTSYGVRAIALQGNLADPEAAGSFVERTIDQLGGIDVLVCNAAIYAGDEVEKVTAEQYDAVLNINTRSSFFITQAAATAMLTVGRAGAIVHVLSGALARPETGNGLYRMSKSAQLMLVESAAYELATRGIRVNAVSPGLTATDMSRSDLEDPARRALALGAVPMGRPATPAEIAEVVLFLADERSSYVTGSVIWADGGRHLGPAAA
jgi:NAD(P)-dependent dehydrogenase (short-subunit alcohol dehydrogenase family)